MIYKDNYIIWIKLYYSYNTCFFKKLKANVNKKFVIVNLDNFFLKLFYLYFGAKLFLMIPTIILLKHANLLKLTNQIKNELNLRGTKTKKANEIEKKEKKIEDLRANAKCIKHLFFNPFL